MHRTEALWSLLGAVCKTLLWLGLWNVAALCQTIWWLLTGTYVNRKRSVLEESYAISAQVLDIRIRYKYDVIMSPNELKNFIVTHNRFDRPDIVLKDNMTLYTVKQDCAVFVETDPEENILDAEKFPFLKVPQFQLSRRVVVLPMKALGRLYRERVGRPRKPVIFLSNISRCGSTLLCQIFQRSMQCVSLCEPDILSQLGVLEQRLNDEEFNHILEVSVGFLCRTPVKGPEKGTRYLIKMAGLSNMILPKLYRLFPDSVYLFMYRNGLDCITSQGRMYKQQPLVKASWSLVYLFPQLNKLAVTAAGKVDYPAHLITSRMSLFASRVLLYCIKCKQYINLREEGFPVFGVKYEHVVANPRLAISNVFKHCDIHVTESVMSNVLASMDKDSQENSTMSRHNISKHSGLPFTPDVEVEADAICDYMKIPRLREKVLFDGTVTEL